MDYPIVFIPGIFGSLGNDVIPGTGEFSFGLAEDIYRPFIEILNSMGYIEGENLFVSYYDWKKTVLESVDKYLFPDIEKIKKLTGSNKVIIIGHSLGGLLGRAYTTYYGPSIVDKLVLIGTPNLGAVNAYSFWSGGKLPYSKVEDNILYNGIKLGFILYFRLFEDINYIDAVRRIFPVASDLLPSNEYGNYLFWEEKGIKREIPIEGMSIKNSFLNRLNKEKIDQNYLYIVSGKGSHTNKEYLVELDHREKSKWTDGKPIKAYITNYGDGTVTTFSTLGNLGGHNIVLKGNHIDILYKSKNYLSEILKKPILKEVKVKEIEKVHVILASNCRELDIITSDHSKITERSIDINDDRVKVIDLGGNNYWIMATGDNDLEIKLNVESTKKVKPKIYSTFLKNLYSPISK